MLNRDRILFVVPIYRETESEYYSKLDELDKRNQERQEQIMRKFLGDASRSYDLAKEIADSTPPIPDRKAWRYNRIVGWIEFYSDRRTIKADLWLSKGKRPPTNFRSVTLEHKGKIADVCLAHRGDNPDIRQAITSFLDGLAKGLYGRNSFKGLFVDKTLLLQQLDFLNIKALIDKIENGRAHKVPCPSCVKSR